MMYYKMTVKFDYPDTQVTASCHNKTEHPSFRSFEEVDFTVKNDDNEYIASIGSRVVSAMLSSDEDRRLMHLKKAESLIQEFEATKRKK